MSISISVRAIICDDDKIFLCVNSANKPMFWCLPGGRLEEGETLINGLQRELFEEFGVEAQIGDLLYVRELIDDKNNCIDFFFFVDNPEVFHNICIKNATTVHEINDFAFIEIDKMNDYSIKPETLTNLIFELKNKVYKQSTKYIGNVK